MWIELNDRKFRTIFRQWWNSSWIDVEIRTKSNRRTAETQMNYSGSPDREIYYLLLLLIKLKVCNQFYPLFVLASTIRAVQPAGVCTVHFSPWNICVYINGLLYWFQYLKINFLYSLLTSLLLRGYFNKKMLQMAHRLYKISSF